MIFLHAEKMVQNLFVLSIFIATTTFWCVLIACAPPRANKQTYKEEGDIYTSHQMSIRAKTRLDKTIYIYVKRGKI